MERDDQGPTYASSKRGSLPLAVSGLALSRGPAPVLYLTASHSSTFFFSPNELLWSIFERIHGGVALDETLGEQSVGSRRLQTICTLVERSATVLISGPVNEQSLRDKKNAWLQKSSTLIDHFVQKESNSRQIRSQSVHAHSTDTQHSLKHWPLQ